MTEIKKLGLLRGVRPNNARGKDLKSQETCDETFFRHFIRKAAHTRSYTRTIFEHGKPKVLTLEGPVHVLWLLINAASVSSCLHFATIKSVICMHLVVFGAAGSSQA